MLKVKVETLILENKPSNNLIFRSDYNEYHQSKWLYCLVNSTSLLTASCDSKLCP